MSLSLVIPTLEAESCLPRLLQAVRRQTVRPDEIIVIDSCSIDGTVACARESGCRVKNVGRHAYRHGRARNQAAGMAQGDFIVFLTQDVLPRDERCLEHLVGPLRAERASAAYARQVAYPHASPPEVFLRRFNYPDSSQRRTIEDLPRMGIKTFFFSNAASAVRRDVLTALGGFPDDVIMNEDMLFCAKLLRAGHAVAYQAGSVVFHSHDYSLATQFGRYFDIGVFRSQAGKLLDGAGFGGTGRRFARQQVAYLLRTGAWRWVVPSMAATVVKAMAFHLGSHHRRLPLGVKRRLSMHRGFWAQS